MSEKETEDTYTDEEAERRRDAALKRMLKTPPRQHKEDVGKVKKLKLKKEKSDR